MRILSFALTVALLAQATASRADDATDRSRAAFKAGAHAFDQGKAAEALDLFKEAYHLHPSYVTWYNIGLCESALGHPVEASDAFHAYLREGGAQVEHDKVDAVTKLADESEAKVARLIILVSQPAARVSIDGSEVNARELRVDPGMHAIEARAEGFNAERARIKVESGKRVKLQLDLAPLDVEAPPPRPAPVLPAPAGPRFDALFFSAAGLSLVAFVAGGIMGADALHDYHLYKDPAVSDSVAAHAKSQGQVLKVTTDFAFGFGVAAGIAAGLLATRRRAPEPPRATVTFDLGPSRGSIGVRALF